MKILAAPLILTLFCCQLAAAETCSEILSRNYVQEFADLREQVKEAPDSVALTNIAHRWIEEGTARRDSALSCMSMDQSGKRRLFWSISYAHRFLADTLQPLVVPVATKSTGDLRQQILERVDAARESLDYK